MTGAGPDGHDGSARRVRVQLRLDDLSPSGHVGNASIVRVLEEARTVFLGHARPGLVGYHQGLLEVLGDEARMLIGQQTVEYTKELWYSHDPVEVTLWITHVGRSSFSVAATIAGQDTEDLRPAVSSEATIVLVDRRTGGPWPISDAARAAFDAHRGDLVTLRPRPAVAATARP